jgi:integrase/recombinase XerC
MVEIIIQKIAQILPIVASDDLWAEFGQLKIADSTRRQYVKAIENFCQFAYSGSATPETISEFLDLDRYAAIEMVLRYRRHSIDKNLAPSTINVRLAAIKSLVDMARKLGKTTIDLADIESIPNESYRDTRGISVEQFRSMLAKNAQRAKKVKVHFKPMLCQAFSILTE